MSGGVRLECPRCGKKWEYGGKNKYYATCPDCKTSVKVRR